MTGCYAIHCLPDGSLRFIWEDDLRPLLDLGHPQIRRASHVEPTADGRRWTALMLRHDRGVARAADLLGPFETRAGALEAEREWLERRGF